MTTINSPVNVNAFYFAGKTMRSFPKAIEYQGRAVTFVEGLQLLIRRGQSQTQLYDMETQSGAIYRLSRAEGEWRLLGMRGGY